MTHLANITLYGKSVWKSTNLNKHCTERTTTKAGRATCFWLHHAKIDTGLHALVIAVCFNSINAQIQIGCHEKGVESLSQLFACCFYHNCRNPKTENKSVLCFAFNPIQTGLFSTFWGRGGGSEAPPCNFKTAYTMATKFCQKFLSWTPFPCWPSLSRHTYYSSHVLDHCF